jgi:hypothetical protein
MSTDLDEVLRADDELFQAPPEVAQTSEVQQPAETKPAPRTRASRLQTVADQAPEHQPDDDGVIDMPPIDQMNGHDGDDQDSPI